MASPQLENGYLKIANELYERLYQAGLSGTEYSILSCIIRFSYGMRKTQAHVSSYAVSLWTGRDAANVRRSLRRLVERRFVLCLQNSNGPQPGIYQINKNWETWDIPLSSWPPLITRAGDPEPRTHTEDNGHSQSVKKQGQNDPTSTEKVGSKRPYKESASRVKMTPLVGSKRPYKQGQNDPTSTPAKPDGTRPNSGAKRHDKKHGKNTPSLREGVQGERRDELFHLIRSVDPSFSARHPRLKELRAVDASDEAKTDALRAALERIQANPAGYDWPAQVALSWAIRDLVAPKPKPKAEAETTWSIPEEEWNGPI